GTVRLEARPHPLHLRNQRPRRVCSRRRTLRQRETRRVRRRRGLGLRAADPPRARGRLGTSYGIGITKVVTDAGGIVALKLQFWIIAAGSEARSSLRDVRWTSAAAPSDGSAVRSKVKPLLALASPLRTTSARLAPSALTAATMSPLLTSTN